MKEQKASRGNRGNREEGKHKILGQDSSNKNKEVNEKIQIIDAHRQIVNQGNSRILDGMKEIKLAMLPMFNKNNWSNRLLIFLHCKKNVEKGKQKNYV
jgi:hypothetical protein